MVEINNQRKAFLDMLAWSEELITDVRKPEIMWLWRHCRRKAVYWLLRSPSPDSLNPKLKSTGVPDATSFFPVGGMPQAAWPERLLSKSQDAVACSRLRAWRFTYDWSWWYPSGNRPLQQYLGFTAGRWLWSVRAWADSRCKNSKKRAERSEIDVWAESPRLSLWLSASSSACHGLVIITVITPLPINSATKMPENWSWRTRQLLTCRCVSVMLLHSMQNTPKELLHSTENDTPAAWSDVAAFGRRRLHIKAVYQSVREATTASGVDNAASPDWRTPLNGIISPQREADHYAKTTGKDLSILMSSADTELPISMGNSYQLLWAIHTRFNRSKCLK